MLLDFVLWLELTIASPVPKVGHVNSIFHMHVTRELQYSGSKVYNRVVYGNTFIHVHKDPLVNTYILSQGCPKRIHKGAVTGSRI